MRINKDTKLVGTNVYLIPYERHHVPKYHVWMQSQELQELTASEPLTLEEEYQMQKSWREDEDKCTFIILQKTIYDAAFSEIDAMIGDTNIFITNKDEPIGEIEIMIAETIARGKRLGWETVILMLLYGIQSIGIKIYEAKISLRNNISIQMFKKLGFIEKSRSDVFKEITFHKKVTDSWIKWLQEQYKYEKETYVTQ